MSNCKLVIIDIDGTLVGGGAYPTERVIEAVQAVRAQGIHVAVGTGRASEACYHIWRKLDMNGLHICFDGAAVVNWPSNNIVYLQALPAHAAEKLVSLTREAGLFLEIYAHDFYFIEQDGKLAEHQREKLQLKPLITDLSTLINRIQIVKGQMLAANEDEKKRADWVTEQLGTSCRISWSYDASHGIHFGNAVSRFVSKGQALQQVVDHLGIDISETMAIGDSFNDMPIFRVAQTKVAMGNAPDQLKELASWVAPSVQEDGVAVALEKFILNA